MWANSRRWRRWSWTQLNGWTTVIPRLIWWLSELSGFSEQKEGRKNNTSKLSKFSSVVFFLFFFLNEEANLVPEVPQQTHTYTFTAQTPSWKGDLLTSIVGERKGEVGWLWRAPRSPANTLYCCRNLGLYEVATSRGKMQCIPSFSKDLFEDFLWAGSWW